MTTKVFTQTEILVPDASNNYPFAANTRSINLLYGYDFDASNQSSRGLLGFWNQRRTAYDGKRLIPWTSSGQTVNGFLIKMMGNDSLDKVFLEAVYKVSLTNF